MGRNAPSHWVTRGASAARGLTRVVIRACGVNSGLGAARIDHCDPRGRQTWPAADIEVGGTPPAPRILSKALARTKSGEVASTSEQQLVATRPRWEPAPGTESALGGAAGGRPEATWHRAFVCRASDFVGRCCTVHVQYSSGTSSAVRCIDPFRISDVAWACSCVTY